MFGHTVVYDFVTKICPFVGFSSHSSQLIHYKKCPTQSIIVI